MISEENIKATLEGLVKIADEERKKDPAYQELFKKHEGVESLLRDTEHIMTGAVLDAVQVMKDKFHLKITNEAYKVLLGLPLFEDFLEKHIKDLEGFVCSVDKTYYLLSDYIMAQLKEGENEDVQADK